MSESVIEKYHVKKPIYEIGSPDVKGRQHPTMTFMSDTLVPGCNTYIEFGWVWDIPKPNPHIPEHAHPHNEIVLHIGSDPNNPEDLGGEVEFVMNNEALIFDKTSALFIPANMKHAPVTWRKVRKPHLQMAIHLGSGVPAKSWPK
jgi:hypothetical protein